MIFDDFAVFFDDFSLILVENTVSGGVFGGRRAPGGSPGAVIWQKKGVKTAILSGF